MADYPLLLKQGRVVQSHSKESIFSPVQKNAIINKKSGSALPTPDKHKTGLPERRPLPFWEVLLVTSRG
ncbi:hypothetical protein BK139_00205 [Paenibacillus sp. FSL R5-0490]|nr:hypothetical protein BK139_00205 [Paenibacillus sp. FSL R5-0490]